MVIFIYIALIKVIFNVLDPPHSTALPRPPIVPAGGA